MWKGHFLTEIVTPPEDLPQKKSISKPVNLSKVFIVSTVVRVHPVSDHKNAFKWGPVK